RRLLTASLLSPRIRSTGLHHKPNLNALRTRERNLVHTSHDRILIGVFRIDDPKVCELATLLGVYLAKTLRFLIVINVETYVVSFLLEIFIGKGGRTTPRDECLRIL